MMTDDSFMTTETYLFWVCDMCDGGVQSV